jgi:hypothetical protein
VVLKLILAIFIVGNLHAADNNFKAKKFASPIREVSIIVTDSGFYPNKIMAHEGEKIHFFITSTAKKAQCFVLQKHEVFVSAEVGVVNEAEVYVNHSGRFKFFCPSFEFKGYLTVIEKESAVEDQVRGIASQSVNKPSYWLPRDYD